MKYIKGKQTSSSETYKKSKMRLTDGDDFSENIWVGIIPDSNEVMLLNHALAFYPFESWGAILPNSSSFNFLETLEKQELTLHPEAWDALIERKIINEEGEYIKQEEQV
jgi:hypothetical protein